MIGWIAKNTTDLNLRRGPSTQHTILVRLPTGTLLQILDQEGAWLKVVASNRVGYVHSDYVEYPDIVKISTPTGLYAGPDVDTFIQMTIPADTYVYLFSEIGAWLHVYAWGQEGYIPRANADFPRIGRTSDTLNIRMGPSTTYASVGTLPPYAPVYIWGEEGKWFHIADTVHVGYVHSDYVWFEGEGPPPTKETEHPVISPPQDSSMAPPDAEKIRLPSGAGRQERQIAAIWNRLGGLLKALSEKLGIDPAVAVAVLAVESGGRAFNSEGRMIIRFENQIFYDKWGQQHPEIYNQHFKFNPNRRWLDHQWRPTTTHAWRTCHKSQQVEWEVFEFARTLDDTAAKLAISMGGPQIMGLNYAILDYPSVQQMFTAFSKSEGEQIMGLFAFIQSRNLVPKLQALDFEGFARTYNGPGQAQRYGQLIRGLYEAYHRLR